MDFQNTPNRESIRTFFVSDTPSQCPRGEVRSDLVTQKNLEMDSLWVHHSQLLKNRESFQTLVSSDTATQYPRREVRSEWAAANMVEIAAFEEHQEALKHTENVYTGSPNSKLGRTKLKRLMICMLVNTILFLILSAMLDTVGNAGSRSENDDDEIPLFNRFQFRDVCNKLRAQANPLVFGACFPDGKAGFCDAEEGSIGVGSENFICRALQGNGETCVCPPGRLIELVRDTEGDLCNAGFQCPLVDLSIVTQTPTTSPTPQSVFDVETNPPLSIVEDP